MATSRSNGTVVQVSDLKRFGIEVGPSVKYHGRPTKWLTGIYKYDEEVGCAGALSQAESRRRAYAMARGLAAECVKRSEQRSESRKQEK